MQSLVVESITRRAERVGGGGLRLDSLSLLPNLLPSTTRSLSATPLLEQSISSWKWSTSLPTLMGQLDHPWLTSEVRI